MPKIITILPAVSGGCLMNTINLCGLFNGAGYDAGVLLTYDTSRSHFDRDCVKKENGTIANSVFEYSPYQNKYYLFKNLAKELNSKKADIIILNDWIDHSLLKYEKVEGKIISILHGDYDYYYSLATESEGMIDHFVCVSEEIYNKLIVLLPHREDDIFCILPCVKDVFFNKGRTFTEGQIAALFVGRMTKDKGFPLLPFIDDLLKGKGIDIKWSVIAPKYTDAYDVWLSEDGKKYYAEIPNQDIAKVYKASDVLLLPSQGEGFPLVIIEAMKSGVIPIISDLPTIAKGIIADDISGYRLKADDIEGFANKIASLLNDTAKRKSLSEKGMQIAEELFGERQTLNSWLKVFALQKSSKSNYTTVSNAFDRLDNKWIPDLAVVPIRKFIKWKQRERDGQK